MLNSLQALFLSVLLSGIQTGRTEPFLDFIHISDTHVANFAGVHPKIVAARARNMTSSDQLIRFLEQIRDHESPAFILHSGDAVDASCFDSESKTPVGKQIEYFRSIMSRNPIAVYLALGNHDVECYRQVEGRETPAGDQSVAADARRQWRRAFRCFREGTYYSFSREVGATRYRFLVLDNGETYAEASPYYRKQTAWLRKQLTRRPDDVIILVMHVPLGEDRFSQVVGSLVAERESVVLSLAGHRHSDAVEEADLSGELLVQVRTASLSASPANWRRIRLLTDRIEIAETGYPEKTARIIALPKTHKAQVTGLEPVPAHSH